MNYDEKKLNYEINKFFNLMLISYSYCYLITTLIISLYQTFRIIKLVVFKIFYGILLWFIFWSFV